MQNWTSWETGQKRSFYPVHHWEGVFWIGLLPGLVRQPVEVADHLQIEGSNNSKVKKGSWSPTTTRNSNSKVKIDSWSPPTAGNWNEVWAKFKIQKSKEIVDHLQQEIEIKFRSHSNSKVKRDSWSPQTRSWNPQLARSEVRRKMWWENSFYL